MQHAQARTEIHTGFWRGQVKARHALEDLGLDGRIILQCILEKQVEDSGSGLNCLRMEIRRDDMNKTLKHLVP
jgi:hypothetical protein